MAGIPGVNHQDAVRALEKAGFQVVRQGVIQGIGRDFRLALPAFSSGGIGRKTWSVIETALPRLFELRSFSLVGIALVPPKR